MPTNEKRGLTPGQIEKRRLFDVFAANLQLYFPDIQDTFVCPLCKKCFTRESIDDALSLAHIVPKGLGGKNCVLTCKDCNSWTGTTFDSQAIAERKFVQLLAGNGSSRVRFVIDDVEIAGIWRRALGTSDLTRSKSSKSISRDSTSQDAIVHSSLLLCC